MRIYCLIFLMVFVSLVSKAQTTCTALGQNPETAFPVCGTTTFHQTTVPFCGDRPVATPPGCGAGLTDKNPFWYKFTCYTAGTLGFLITPDNNNEDYDWQLYDITGHAYSEVYSNSSLIVGCNWSGLFGVTGTSATETVLFVCGGGIPIFSAMPTLIQGHDYLLLVSHWSNTPNGYTLSFSKGTASITDPVVPNMVTTTSACDRKHVNVKLNKRILCNSIASDGSDFTINAPGVTVTNAVSVTCSNSFDTDELTLTLSAQLPAGPYIITAKDGTDLNTLLDFCGNPLPIGNTVPVVITAVPATLVDNISYTGCAPTVLNVKLTKPVLCNTITFSGSNGEVTIQPGNIIPLSLQGVCTGTNPIADLIHINMTNPLPFGNYQLVIHPASADGNTFIDTCSNELVPISIPFTINQTTVAPAIQSVVFDECHPDKLVVNFDRPVMCSTISPNANEFSITPGALPISNVNYTCGGVGNYITQAVLTLQNPLPAGNFAVTIVPGADGTTLADTCFAFMANGANKTFVTTKAPAPKFDSVQFDKCNPSFVKLFYSNAIRCASVNANGSGYTITGPSAVNITGAVTDGNCGTLGYTKWVQLQFAQPVNVFGNYIVHNGGGITDTCSAAQNIAETIAFNALVKPSAAFTSQVKFGCKMDTVVLSHAGGNGINSWTWLFPDGSTATGQTVTKLFPVTTASVTIQLTVDNGSCNDVISQTVTLGNSFKAAFATTPKDTTCINTPINFANNSTGTNLQYLWLFGDNTQFAGQTPPTHAYTSNNAYTIKLVATDTYGCKDTAAAIVQVLAAPTIDFTGLAPQYCSDKSMTLTKVAGPTILTYTWNDGDGMTVQNKPSVLFTYPNQGVYTITLTGVDKYCGNAVVSKQVQIYAVPNLNLGNDTVLCPATTLQIGPAPIAGYTYLWSNGATTSQINTAIATASYSLQVDNNGCTASDAISVKVLTACLIMVPNAFTPNNDGNNDRLKPTNADLAKEFSFKVYNRYGQLIYATNNPNEGWDGTRRGVRSDAGTYIWQLSYTDPWNGKKVVQNGTSILLR
ncbi:PKD domain-containing protein [Ferruginibacter sp. SUN106]|uniref:gliding motility-associated C-terminal domain-containing protein n=1 Tax=Ferruginibacter sp. SUN106 TaxID=2978348 RepID=UPI003D36F036